MPFCVCVKPRKNKSSVRPPVRPAMSDDGIELGNVSLRTSTIMAIKREKPKVVVTRAFPGEAINILQEHYDVLIWDTAKGMPRNALIQHVKGASGILCTFNDKIDSEILDAAGPNLKVVATMSADFVNVDVKACRARNIELLNVTDLTINVTAETTCALLLFTARKLMAGYLAARNGHFQLGSHVSLCGTDLKGHTMGFLGFGRMGLAVATRFANFDLGRILYVDIVENPKAAEVKAEKVELDELLQESDFLICCLGLTEDTKGYVNADMFSKCKPDCIFINVSRGEVVNHADLLDALQEGKIAAAGLDVTEPEPLPTDHDLLKMANCVITPHMGTSGNDTRLKMAVDLATGIADVLK